MSYGDWDYEYQRNKYQRQQEDYRQKTLQRGYEAQEEQNRIAGGNYGGGSAAGWLALFSVVGGFLVTVIFLAIMVLTDKPDEPLPVISFDTGEELVVATGDDGAEPHLTIGDYEAVTEKIHEPVDGEVLGFTPYNNPRTIDLEQAFFDVRVATVRLYAPEAGGPWGMKETPITKIELILLTDEWLAAFANVDTDDKTYAAQELASLVSKFASRGLLPVEGVSNIEEVAFEKLNASPNLEATLWIAEGNVVETIRLDGKLRISVSLEK